MTSARRPNLADRVRSRLEWLRRARTSGLAAGCGISLAAAIWFGAPRAVSAVRSHPYFALTRIAVEGNHWLGRDEILRWAGISHSSSVWDAAPTTLRTRLLSHPRVAHVAIWREFPNRLVIRVQERRPVAIVLLDELEYVDRAGHILGPLRDEDSRDFPLITGLEDEGARDFVPIGVRRAVRLSRLYERINCVEALSEIHVDRRAGVTLFPLRTATAVVLGWGGWREKLARSARVFAAWDGQVGRLAAVDVSFRDIVVVRLHEEQQPQIARIRKRGLRV